MLARDTMATHLASLLAEDEKVFPEDDEVFTNDSITNKPLL